MQITHLGHAAVLVETGAARILIDPGAFSDDWHGLTDLDAVLVTHQHPDHIDVAHLPALIAGNPGARWIAEPSTVPLIEQAAAQPFRPGDSAVIADVTIHGVGGTHAVIHPELPVIGNTGMLLRAEGEPTLFHPGDSYAAVPEGVDVAAVPLSAPWSKLAECVGFVRSLAPGRWFPIHDALLNERGRSLYLDRTAALAGHEVVDLRTAPLVA